MDIKQIRSRCRWLFFREGTLYVLVFIVAIMCIDLPAAERGFKARKLNDLVGEANVSQLMSFSKGEVSASAVNWENLAKYFRLIMESFQSQEVAEMFLGLCEYYGFGREDVALQYIQHSADSQPGIYWNVYNTGLLFFKKGEMGGAIVYLQRSLLLPPGNVMHTIATSVLYRQLFDGVKDINFGDRFRQARENAFLLVAAAYYDQKNYDMAQVFASKGVLDPGIEIREPFYYYAGAIAMQKGDLDGALSFFDRAIKANTKNPLVFRFAADILKRSGRNEEAQRMSQMGQAFEKEGRSDKFFYPSRLEPVFF